MKQILQKHRMSVVTIVFFALIFAPVFSSLAHANMGDFIYKLGQFYVKNPSSMAVDPSGNVYVSSSGSYEVIVFSNTGVFLRKWGSHGTGIGQFSQRQSGIAINAASNEVYVLDWFNANVQVFSAATGSYLRKWGSYGAADNQFMSPKGLALDSAGNVYVTEAGRVKVFDSMGNFLTKWSAGGGNLFGIAVDGSGFVYVTDTTNNIVKKFSNGTSVDGGTLIQTCGSPGSGDLQFDTPEGMMVDPSGNVYVTDSYNYRVQGFRFNSDSNTCEFLYKWGSQGEMGFSFPTSIAPDPYGNIYVADVNSAIFQLFTNTGTLLKRWTAGSGEGVFSEPGGVATDSNGNVYVTDTNNNRVQVFSNTHELLAKWGSLGSGHGQFSSPKGIAVDSSDNVYVADTGNNRVEVFSSGTGSFIGTWGSNGQLSSPQGVDVDEAGNIYVADAGNNRIAVFSASSFTTWGSYGSGNGQLSIPSDIALDADGTKAYVADRGNSRVQVFNTSTGSVVTPPWGSYGTGNGQFKNLQALTVDAGGNVYVTDSDNDRVQVFDGTGNFIDTWGSHGTGDAQFITPMGIAIDPAGGNVYVADKVNHLVKIFQGACALTANAGSSQTVEQTSCLGASVTLDGSGSVQVGYCSGELSYSWSWPGGSATGVSPSVLMPPGTTHVTLTVTNGTLTSTSSVDITVHDTLPPVTTAIINGTLGTNGWYVSDVNILLTATDACVKEIHYTVDGIEMVVPGGSASFSLVSEGTHSVSYYAVDNVNLIETPPHLLQIKIDKTLPTIISTQTPTPNANGWNNTDVAVSFRCSDAVSGIVSCPTSTDFFTAEGALQAITGTAVDEAGLISIATVTVNIDKTPPVITACFSPGAVTPFSYTPSDSLSHIASDSVNPLEGEVNGAGIYTYAVKATDYAGNTANLTAVYDAMYNFTGYLAFSQKWGTAGSGDGQLYAPQGIAVDGSGNVYVADRGNNRVEVFSSSTGTYVRSWGAPGSDAGQFNNPGGLAASTNGNVYVADTYNNRVQIFSSTGAFLGAFGTAGSGSGQFNNPSGLAVASSGNVYVADTGNNRVQRFDSTGTFLGTFCGGGQFNNPTGLAVDLSGNVYVADTGHNRVQVCSSTGTLLGSLGAQGSGDGQFNNPSGIAVDSSGNVYVADISNRVQVFDNTGTFLGKWGAYGVGDGHFNGIYGISVDSSGNAYVTDTGNNRVQVFAPSSN